MNLNYLEIDSYPLLAHINIVSVSLRLLLSIVLGGILGIERGRKRRPAGFRTYVVVCIGSTLAMLTNQYLYEYLNAPDPSRIAAQVVSGIGFLGAGTIMVTGHSQVKGLTTAAGLWGAAALGLAIGCGFYTGAVLGCLCLFIAMQVLHTIDTYLMRNAKCMLVYVEFKDIKCISRFLGYLRANQINACEMEMNRVKGQKDSSVSIITNLQLPKKKEHIVIIEKLSDIDGVTYIEEIS